jgi:sphinganine-1-phosphate aldolase
LKKNILSSLLSLLLYIPLVQDYIDKKGDKIKEQFRASVKSQRKNQVYQLPEVPMKPETILNRMQQGSETARGHFTKGAKISGAVYTTNTEHWDFISECMRLHIESNPLHNHEFSYISQLEAEIININCRLFNGPPTACGLLTSGGTESIFITVLAYREQGRKRGIKKPNIVVS